MALLEVDDLHVYYGHIHALKGLSLRVEAGEIVTLIGANGAGKSTALRTISGLLPLREGRVSLDAAEIAGTAPHHIVAMGLVHVPEGRRIFNRLTVVENLQMGAYARSDGAIRPDLDRVFSLFPRLRDRRGQVAGTLSGGEQQMLAMARGLMARPRLLLLDEPSMGLAPVLVEQIFETIQDISGQGTTILLVEQNAAMALAIADRGYVLETGRVVLDGPARDLSDNSELRRAYLGESA